MSSQCFACFFEFAKERGIDFALACVFGNQIPKKADLCLFDAVDATKALFETIRIPRDVIVDHQMGALQVDTFAGCIGSKEHLHVCGKQERVLCGFALFAADASVNNDDRVVTAKQRRDALSEVVKGVFVLGKDDDFLRTAAMGQFLRCTR